MWHGCQKTNILCHMFYECQETACHIVPPYHKKSIAHKDTHVHRVCVFLCPQCLIKVA